MNNINDIDSIENFYNEIGIKETYKENLSDENKLYSAYLKNLRDVKKLLNAFRFHYAVFKKKNIRINISDLLLITAIKVFNYPLWQSIYKNKEVIVINKKPFYEAKYFREGHKLYIERNKSNNNLFNWKTENNANSIAQLKKFEVRIIQSLFPFNKSTEGEKEFIEGLFIDVLDDHKTYSLKRIKDSLPTFKLYFQFNPPESKLPEISKLLKTSDQSQKVLDTIKTNTDYSDLFDLVNSDAYKSYRTSPVILNIIALILNNKEICECLYQDESNYIFSPEAGKMDNLPLKDIQSLIKKQKNILSDNFDSFVKVIYDIFMYTEYRSERKDVRQNLSDEENKIKKDLIIYLENNFTKIDFLSIEKTTMWNLYYAFGWKDLIKQKAYKVMLEASDEYILDFFLQFSSESLRAKEGNVIKCFDFSFIIENIFENDKENKVLERFKSIQNNSQIMNNEKYFQYFGRIKQINEDKYMHLVDFVIERLNPKV